MESWETSFFFWLLQTFSSYDIYSNLSYSCCKSTCKIKNHLFMTCLDQGTILCSIGWSGMAPLLIGPGGDRLLFGLRTMPLRNEIVRWFRGNDSVLAFYMRSRQPDDGHVVKKKLMTDRSISWREPNASTRLRRSIGWFRVCRFCGPNT
jgi:hypothetical protein